MDRFFKVIGSNKICLKVKAKHNRVNKNRILIVKLNRSLKQRKTTVQVHIEEFF